MMDVGIEYKFYGNDVSESFKLTKTDQYGVNHPKELESYILMVMFGLVSP